MATMNSIDSSKGRLRGTYIAIMIPLGVAINYVGGQIASSLGLPIYLDSIGTVIVAAIMGPWVGAISGALYNIISALIGGNILGLACLQSAILVQASSWAFMARRKQVPHDSARACRDRSRRALECDCRFAHRNGCLRRCGRQYWHQFDDCGPAGVRAGSDGRRIPCPYPCQSSRQGHCLLHRMDYSA